MHFSVKENTCFGYFWKNAVIHDMQLIKKAIKIKREKEKEEVKNQTKKQQQKNF